ncbi:hypothetical protein N7454_000725 [Penicillium verhagenii]|nr:hypothetical protein N7454_000725 [Penicillium verhagenii]
MSRDMKIIQTRPVDKQGLAKLHLSKKAHGLTLSLCMVSLVDHISSSHSTEPVQHFDSANMTEDYAIAEDRGIWFWFPPRGGWQAPGQVMGGWECQSAGDFSI